MPPDKDKRFTEDFVRKWSRAGGAKKKQISKNERILKNQQEILRKDPRNHKIWFARGILLAEMGRFGKALRCFDAVIKLDPRNKAVYNSKASALLQMGEIEQSSTWYRRALDMSSEEIAPEIGAAMSEQLPAEEVLREMIEESREWEETIRMRACPICGSNVLWEAKICPTCEWEFHDEDYEELAFDEEDIRPERELTEGEMRERLIGKIEEYRLEGYEVAPIVRTMKTEPHRARGAVAQFEENVAEIRKFKKNLESMETTGFDMKLKEMDQLFRSPYNMFAIRNEYDKLIRRIEARQAKRTKRPKARIGREPPTVGLTNGMRGRVNGLGKDRPAGLTNGRMGRINGMVNGRGRVNGMVNGRGRINGVTNGLIYRFQTMKTGLVNGITNGNGMTNGLGSIRFQNENKRKKWKLTIIPFIAILLLTTPFFLYTELPVSEIEVDGEFDDWSGVQKIASARDLSISRNIDIISVAAKKDNKYLSLYAEVDSIALGGNPATGIPDTIHFLLDVDSDASTGYLVRGIGADYVIRIMGHGGVVMTSSLYGFGSGADQNNWSAWDSSGRAQAAVSTRMLETQISYKSLNGLGKKVSILVHSSSHDGSSDFADYVISDQRGVLVIEQFWSDQAEELAGGGNTILTITARALGNRMRINSLTAYLTGDAAPTELERVRVLAAGTEVGAINSPQTGMLRFTFSGITVNEDETVAITLDATVRTASGNTLGAKVSFSSDFEPSSGVASLEDSYPEGSMDYIGQADTSQIKIDGGFSDWNGVEIDQDNVTVSNPNIDVAGFATKTVQRSFPSVRVDAFFYVNVAGRIAGGSLVPYASPGPLKQLVYVPDSDRDTVPDSIDIYPFDFDNDGTPDVEEGSDIDSDQILDYPLGSDYYLETTIPVGYPSPYGGKEVRIYIGPRTVPTVTGEDYIRAFVDIDGNVGGYAIGPIYADYLLEIRGKNGDINWISLMEFDGESPTDWDWTSTGSEVSASLDMHRIEATADATDLVGDRFEVVFETSDWEDGSDMTTNLSGRGRSATRGSFGDYDVRFTSENYDAYLTDLADKVSFSSGGNQLSWTIPRSIQWDSGGDTTVLGELIPSWIDLDRGAARYENTYSGLDVSIEYLFEENMLKENIILERALDGVTESGHISLKSDLQFEKSLMVYADGDEYGEWSALKGGMAFRDKAGSKFQIRDPYAVDARGDVLDCQYFYNAQDKLLDLRCDSSWFLAADYPIRIDPTVTAYTLENDDGTLGQASEYFGWSVAVGDFNNDTYADVATGAPYADVGSNTDAGAVYIYYGPFSATDTSPDVMIVANITGAHLGWAIASGDFNTDYATDLVVTQIANDAYAYYGYEDWAGWDVSPDVTFDVSAFQELGTENFGNAVAVGNIDYNAAEPLNFDDVIFGANLSDLPGNGPGNTDGMAFIFVSMFASTESGEDGKIAPSEDSNDGEFATSLACGKIDNDDIWDIVAGEPQNNSGDGTVHIYLGKNLALIGTDTDDAYLAYEYADEQFGLSVAVGNMDSDSYMDILVGAPKNDEYGSADRGRAYVYQANTDGSGITDSAAPDLDLAGPGAADGAEFGYSVAVADFEGDGVGDAIVGARYNASGGTDRGSVMIFDDPITTNNATDYFIDGTQNSEYLGWSLATGKYSGDGVLILAAGASFWDDGSPSETDAGRVMIMVIPEYLDNILFVPLLLAVPIVLKRRKRKSL